MTTSAFTSPSTSLSTAPSSAPIPDPVKKKRVLLVDTSSVKRDLRAEVMRKLGMDVDSAADIGEARSWWRADLYDLVLINMESDLGYRDKFCDDIRSATPSQPIAFLVGKPEYLAGAPNADEVVLAQNGDEAVPEAANVIGRLDGSGESPIRWGILEASRQISAARSASNARTRAMRNRPAPPRDSEVRPSKRAMVSKTLDELIREEMQ